MSLIKLITSLIDIFKKYKWKKEGRDEAVAEAKRKHDRRKNRAKKINEKYDGFDFDRLDDIYSDDGFRED